MKSYEGRSMKRQVLRLVAIAGILAVGSHSFVAEAGLRHLRFLGLGCAAPSCGGCFAPVGCYSPRPTCGDPMCGAPMYVAAPPMMSACGAPMCGGCAMPMCGAPSCFQPAWGGASVGCYAPGCVAPSQFGPSAAYGISPADGTDGFLQPGFPALSAGQYSGYGPASAVPEYYAPMPAQYAPIPPVPAADLVW